MSIEIVPTSKLSPDPNQPRTDWNLHSDHISGLARSYAIHGIIDPITVDKNNTIILGECRWRAAKKAGLKTVPVRRMKVSSQHERFEKQLIDDAQKKDLTDQERVWAYATAIASINDPKHEYTVPQIKRIWSKTPQTLLTLVRSGDGKNKSGTAELSRRIGVPQQTISYVMKYFDERIPASARQAFDQGKLKPTEIHQAVRVEQKQVREALLDSIAKERTTSKSKVSINAQDRVAAIRKIEERGGSKELLIATAEAKIEPEDAEVLAEVPVEAQPEAVRVVKKQPTSFARKAAARQIAVEVPSRTAEVQVSSEQIEKLRAQAKTHTEHMAQVDADPQVQELQRLYQSSTVFFGLKNQIDKAYCPVCDKPASKELRFLCHPDITIADADRITTERWGKLKAKKEATKGTEK